MKKVFFCLCLIFSSLVFSCGYGTDNYFYSENQVDERIDKVIDIDPFEKNEFKDIKTLDKYRLLILADTHFGSPYKNTEEHPLFTWLDNIKAKDGENYPKFCMILGDLVDHGYKDEYEHYVKFTTKLENEYKIKVISVLGNHDLYNSGWEHYKKMVYPYCSLFKFQTKNLSWYGIDAGTGNIGIKQFKLIKKALENDSRPKVIMMHYPLGNRKLLGVFCLHDTTERNLLVSLFARNNVRTVLCGHLHQDGYIDYGQYFQEYGNPSFCYSSPAWTLYEVDETKAYIKELDINYLN